MYQRSAYLSADWPDWVFENIRAIRRHASQNEAGDKHMQRRVKSATLLLHYFFATGPFEKRVPSDAFPAELQSVCNWIMVEATERPNWQPLKEAA